jgi:predicted CoA-binding protein
MKSIPPSVQAFLSSKPIVVAGVSRVSNAPANAIFRRLRESGYAPIPVNPNAAQLEGVTSYPSVEAVPGDVHGVMVVTHPSAAPQVVRAALARGVRHIWFHRSFGDGSVSAEAVELCRAVGVEPIVGGCPMMYCPPVDVGHRLFRWWLRRTDRVPG